ncbi:MAG: hypothetical protein J6S61_04515 [Elusimicrobiaceae bacterium]|nr:hypothetical protein [Elusimicrobiaceae bacterium]
MSRKILKVLISILFLIVAAVAAILSIKSFFPELLEEIKYGLKHIVEEPARKTPAFKKDNQGNNHEVKPVVVTPLRPIPLQRPPYRGDENKYGVAPVNKLGLYIADVESKYGVAPVQTPPRDMMSKYGVAPVRRTPGKYGVAPVFEDAEKGE